MFKYIKIFFIINFQIIYINCVAFCNKETNLPPSSEYHCSGLEINNITNGDDKYCCFWKFIDNITNKEITRCASISEDQFKNLDEYINYKSTKYKNINIKCAESQNIYCSNIVLDEEQITECKDLPIYNSKDKYCCRWTFEDSDNYNKKNDYCASINEFEYLNIKQYIKYKNEDPEQRYEKLQINCEAKYILNLNYYFIYLILSLFLFL